MMAHSSRVVSSKTSCVVERERHRCNIKGGQNICFLCASQMKRHIKIPFTARCISMHLEPALILDIPVVFVNVKAAKINSSDFLFVCLLKRLGTGSTEPCKTINIHVTNLSLLSRFSKVPQNAPSFPTIRFVKAPDIISHPLRSSATAAVRSPFLFQFLQPF